MHTSGLWEMKTEVCTLILAKRVDLVKVNTHHVDFVVEMIAKFSKPPKF